MQMHSRSFIMPRIGVLGDIDLPRCARKQADGCFRRMYRTPTSSSANAKKSQRLGTDGDSPQRAPPPITHRTCREMQPLHLDDDARASSLLRRVTGDLYIGESSIGPAPVSRPTLWSRDVMRRNATRRDPTRLLRRCATLDDPTTACDIRALGATRAPHHGVVAPHLRSRATPEEGN